MIALAFALQAATPLPPPPSRYPVVEVRLADGRMTAPTLHRGQRYALRLINMSRREKRFAAPAFFTRAAIVPSRIAYVRHGGVLVRPGRSVELLLAAPRQAGRYRIAVAGPLAGRQHAAIAVD